MEIDYEIVREIQERMILHWNYRNLREIPPEVFLHGDHVQEIYLKRNCIDKLPMEIGRLRCLTNLYLIGNQLSTLPEEMGQLRYLKVLDLSQNYFQRLPSSIGDLGELKHLLLTYNQLDSLPSELKKLKKLVFLEMSGNRLTYFPEEIIAELHALEELAIDRNPISYLPRSISHLRSLRYVSACKCDLKFLPGLPFYPLVNDRSRTSPRLRATTPLNNFRFLFDGNPKLNYIPYWVFQLLGPYIDSFGCAIETEEMISPSLDSTQAKRVSGTNSRSSNSTYIEERLKFQDEHRPKMQLNFKGKCYSLHFDEDLMKLGQAPAIPTMGTTTKECSTLLDMCLRYVYNHRDSYRGSWKSQCTSCLPPKCQSQRSEFVSVVQADENPLEKQQQWNQHRSQSADEEQDEQQNLLPPNLTRLLANGPMARCFECLQPIFRETWPLIFQLPDTAEDHQQQIILEAAGDINEISNGGISIGCAHFCRADCLHKFRTSTKFTSNLAFQNLRFLLDNEISWVQATFRNCN